MKQKGVHMSMAVVQLSADHDLLQLAAFPTDRPRLLAISTEELAPNKYGPDCRSGPNLFGAKSSMQIANSHGLSIVHQIVWPYCSSWRLKTLQDIVAGCGLHA